MDKRIYGRITNNDELFTVEVYGATLIKTVNGCMSYEGAEIWFHHFYPDGYIIPEWLGQ